MTEQEERLARLEEKVERILVAMERNKGFWAGVLFAFSIIWTLAIAATDFLIRGHR